MEGYDKITHFATRDGSATVCGLKIACVLVNNSLPLATVTCDVCLPSWVEGRRPDVAFTKGAE